MAQRTGKWLSDEAKETLAFLTGIALAVNEIAFRPGPPELLEIGFIGLLIGTPSLTAFYRIVKRNGEQ